MQRQRDRDQHSGHAHGLGKGGHQRGQRGAPMPFPRPAFGGRDIERLQSQGPGHRRHDPTRTVDRTHDHRLEPLSEAIRR